MVKLMVKESSKMKRNNEINKSDSCFPLRTIGSIKQVFSCGFLWGILSGLFSFSTQAHAEEISVAVAANFQGTMEKISSLFTKETGHEIKGSYGASGALYSQIKNGAPFYVFLSADEQFPRKLISESLAEEKSLWTYAKGRLVLWSSKDKFIDGPEILHSPKVKHIAVGNPKTVPYGKVAQEFLKKENKWDSLESKMVYGENISQVFQFISTGSAEVGFISYAQMLGRKEQGGSHWMVPSQLHSPINQEAVLVKVKSPSASKQAVAEQFFRFLKTEPIRKIIQASGYE